MTDSLTIGLVQLNAGNVVAENVAKVSALVRDAAKQGAKLVLTPEMTHCMDTRKGILQNIAQNEGDDEALKSFCALARECGIWLLIGSMAVRLDGGKLANRAYLIDDQGDIRAHYDKVHMFDVDLAGGESYRESDNYQAGDRAVVVNTPWGGLGLSICYDLRFPDFYRLMAKAGARLLAVPAAFTKQTGQAHWHSLLKARAIENGCFVLAPAQVGVHANGRETFGHSLAIDPWGHILNDGGEGVGVYLATLDLAMVDEARGRIPSLSHDRDVDVKIL